MKATLKILLRKDYKNSNGEYPIYLRVTIARKVKYFSLKIFVKENDWSEKKCLVKKTDVKHIIKNKTITLFEKKANTIADDFFLQDKQISFYEFEKLLRTGFAKNIDFYEYIQKKIDASLFAKETKRTYTSQLSKLKQFRKKVSINDFTLGFIEDYKTYMITGLGNKLNTFNKSLSMLKTFVNWAVEDKLISENPFLKIKISKEQGNREALTIEEISILEKLLESGSLTPNEHESLKVFIFTCFTGLRFTDINKIKYDNIVNRLIDGVERKFLELEMNKTKKIVSIPLIDKALKFIDKQTYENQNVFKIFCNQVINRHLKSCAKKAKINKSLSFHCARHTLATVGLDVGIPVAVVSKLLGHTDIKTTMIYAKVRDTLKYNEMQKIENF